MLGCGSVRGDLEMWYHDEMKPGAKTSTRMEFDGIMFTCLENNKNQVNDIAKQYIDNKNKALEEIKVDSGFAPNNFSIKFNELRDKMAAQLEMASNLVYDFPFRYQINMKA